MHAIEKQMDRYRSAWVAAGNIESRMLSPVLQQVPIDRPIYITGLARSGTTILLEIVSTHADTASHMYRDYPFILTPALWHLVLGSATPRHQEARERTHKDGVYVTDYSPEAFEEVVWMSFFPNLHAPSISSVLDRNAGNPAFERFYRNHIRKLLWLRGKGRYLAKANYNITRLEYLLELFPDSKFVIPVRDPIWHVASLMKQHAIFCRGERRRPEALLHMRLVGHFEFGLDWRPINAGNRAEIDEIVRLWHLGHDLESWALYWRHIHDFVLRRLRENDRLRAACLVIRFEDLCNRPVETLQRVFGHCDLSLPPTDLRRLAEGLRFPRYYTLPFDAGERALIAEVTRPVAERLGYASE